MLKEKINYLILSQTPIFSPAYTRAAG